MLITPLKTVVIALKSRKKFSLLFRGVSFAALGDDEVWSRYLYCKHYDCTSKAERYSRERDGIKIQQNWGWTSTILSCTTNSLLFDSPGIEFSVFWTRNLVPSRFREQLSSSSHAMCVDATSQFKLQEQKSFLLFRKSISVLIVLWRISSSEF